MRADILGQILAEVLNGGDFKSPEYYNGDQREFWKDRADRILKAMEKYDEKS